MMEENVQCVRLNLLFLVYSLSIKKLMILTIYSFFADINFFNFIILFIRH